MNFRAFGPCKLRVRRMNLKNSVTVTFLTVAIGTVGPGFEPLSAAKTSSQGQDAAQPAVAKRIGVIKTINGNVITLAASGGPEVALTVQPSARVLRLVHGERDLKNATPIQLQELQVGDTIRARGQASD